MSARAGDWQAGFGPGTAAAPTELRAASWASTQQAGLPVSSASASPRIAGAERAVAAEAAPEAKAGRLTSLAPVAARIWLLLNAQWRRGWLWIETRRQTQRRRSLRILETVGMGEKRFVAIVQVEGARFLVGGGSAGVSLLARLEGAPEFADVLAVQASAEARSSSSGQASKTTGEPIAASSATAFNTQIEAAC